MILIVELLSSAANTFQRNLHEKEEVFEAQKRKEISDITTEHQYHIKNLRRKKYYDLQKE